MLGGRGVATADLLPNRPADAVVPDHELPDRIGHYDIGEELGRGGMGIVVAGRDERTGRDVALKVVHTHAVDVPGLLDRFQREVRVGRNVLHPNVVRVFDEGAVLDAEGRALHYLVMERVVGRTLREMIGGLGQIPEALVREIATQTCAGLGAIHAAGVVHRELKPENVVVTAEHVVRIMDLGVARLEEATQGLTHEGPFIGSLLYASPEQLELTPVGPAADLYALGLVLFELLSGNHPYEGGGPAAIVRAHVEGHVPRVQDHAKDVSPFLTAVIETLLEKKPDDRFASADELHGILRQGERSDWWRERRRATAKRLRARPRVPLSNRAELVGREREVESLAASWQETLEGRGAGVLIEAEPGLGKSRLADHCIREVVTDDAIVLYGAFASGTGLAGLRSALRSLGGSTDQVRGAIRSLLGETAAAALLEEVVTGGTALRPEALGPAFGAFLDALCGGKPVLLVLEDVHHAPPSAQRVVRALLVGAEGRRVMVVATSDAAEAAPKSSEARLPGVRHLPLARLTTDQVHEMLRNELSSDDVAMRIHARVAEFTGGVPLLVLETLEALVSRGDLAVRSDGSYAEKRPLGELELPGSARDRLQARLDTLSAAERRTLEAGAIIGIEFDASLVSAALGQPRIAVLQVLAEAERRLGLVRSSGRRHRFDDRAVCDVLAAAIPPALRADLHTRIAEHIEERNEVADVRGETAVSLARHFLRGTAPERALPYLPAALERLSSEQRNADAVGMVEDAIGRVEQLDPRTEVQLLLQRVLSLHMLGRRDDEQLAAEGAVEAATAVGDDVLLARAWIGVARQASLVADQERAVQAYETARVHAARTDDLLHQCTIAQGLGIALVRAGRIDEARDLLQESVKTATEHGFDSTASQALGHLAMSYARAGDLETAETLLDGSLAAGERSGDERSLAMAEWRQGLVCAQRGKTAEATELTKRCADRAAALGDPLLTVWARGGLGVLAIQEGRLADAQQHVRQQLEGAIAVEEHGSVGQALLSLAEVETTLGRGPTAMERLDRALTLAEEIGEAHLRGHAHLLRGILQRMLGSADRAREDLEAACAVFAEQGDVVGDAEALTQLGVLARARREDGAASALFRRAAARAEGSHGEEARAIAGLHLALVADEGTEEAVAAVAAVADRMAVPTRMQMFFLCWRATRDTAHLTEARRLLDHLHQHAPEDTRASLLGNVPLHRAIRAAMRKASRE